MTLDSTRQALRAAAERLRPMDGLPCDPATILALLDALKIADEMQRWIRTTPLEGPTATVFLEAHRLADAYDRAMGRVMS